jgi:hypothetical protein
VGGARPGFQIRKEKGDSGEGERVSVLKGLEATYRVERVHDIEGVVSDVHNDEEPVAVGVVNWDKEEVFVQDVIIFSHVRVVVVV